MIAYLRGEPGGPVVQALPDDPNETCYAHTINLLQVYYDFIRRYSELIARETLVDLAAGNVIERRDLNQPFFRRVGQLKARGGISLADCFCMAPAQQLGGEVVTSDHHEFDPLVPLGIVPIRFIR